MIFSSVPQFPLFAHLWTISVEEQFYVLFPILILLLRRDQAIFALIAILAVVPMLRSLMAQQMAAQSWDPERIAFGVYASSLGQFDAFAFGALLAHFEGNLQRNPRAATRIAWVAVVVTIAYFATYITINILEGARGVDSLRNIISGIAFGQKREVFVYLVVDICAVSILAGAICRWRIFKLIEHPILVRAGQVSYGGYLVHALVLFEIGHLIRVYPVQEPILIRIGWFALVWCFTVALALLSYFIWERRINKYGHKVSQHLLTLPSRTQR
jgi:peptidoglycan/LPS O-acetylase OafA/YrhL